MSGKIVDLEKLAIEVEHEAKQVFNNIEETALLNHAKVLGAFQKSKVSEFHLKGSTGYGYGDKGREILEKVYADIFRAEAALVRGQIVSGTHAIALCLFGVLRPGDELLSLHGEPYDTLAEVIGSRGESPGSLKELSVGYRQVEPLNEGGIDYNAAGQALNSSTKMVYLQRSMGYRWGSSLGLGEIKEAVNFIKKRNNETVVLVDNCYGEFVETEEPIEAGADLVAGSLIKNPGGGLAPTGGYVAGVSKFVDMASNRWSAPGLGSELGPSADFQRLLFQGLFLAPHIVAEALKGAVFASRFFEKLGFEVMPRYDEYRNDIVQGIKLGTPEKMLNFCRGIQKASPVDSHVIPTAYNMPGYGDSVVMAAGTFIQGASLELSADGPMRPPYTVYLQGGLSKEYIKLAVISAAREVINI